MDYQENYLNAGHCLLQSSPPLPAGSLSGAQALSCYVSGTPFNLFTKRAICSATSPHRL